MRKFKNIFEYVFLFCLNGLMLWYFRGYLNLLIAAAMILFLLFDIISVLILKRYLSVSVVVPGEQMPKNITFVVRVNVRNDSVIPLANSVVRLQIGNVFMGETAEQNIEVPLKPLDVTGIELPLCSACVGDVEIRTEKIVLTDFLGLFETERDAFAEDHVFIVPRGETEQEFSLNAFEKGMNEVEETQMKGSDFSDVSQIREYIPGDAIKNIHWKLSAKKDVWMVKERLQMSSQKLLVVLRLERSSEEAADRTIETLYSFGGFLITNHVPLTLCWWSDRFREIRQETAESSAEWLDVMLHVFSTRAGNEMAEQQFRSLYPGQGYVLACEEGLLVKE